MGRRKLSGGPMMGVGSDKRRQAIGADSGGRYESGAASVRIEHRVDDPRRGAGVGVDARPVLPQSGAPARFGAILAGARRNGLGHAGPAVA